MKDHQKSSPENHCKFSEFTSLNPLHFLAPKTKRLKVTFSLDKTQIIRIFQNTSPTRSSANSSHPNHTLTPPYEGRLAFCYLNVTLPSSILFSLFTHLNLQNPSNQRTLLFININTKSEYSFYRKEFIRGNLVIYHLLSNSI